jgi:hypothetical protein
VATLWQACREQSGGDLELARAAFFVRAFRDPAWLGPGAADLKRRIDALE